MKKITNQEIIEIIRENVRLSIEKQKIVFLIKELDAKLVPLLRLEGVVGVLPKVGQDGYVKSVWGFFSAQEPEFKDMIIDIDKTLNSVCLKELK